jgi:hypothetical protein
MSRYAGGRIPAMAPSGAEPKGGTIFFFGENPGTALNIKKILPTDL